MYRQLTFEEHLAFGGVAFDGTNMDRVAVFKALDMPQHVREYWERNITLIGKGFMTQGKFERYLALFRNYVLPLVHTRRETEELIAPKSLGERRRFYGNVWNNLRWRLMFRVFFSRFVMGRLGRDKEFFKYVEGSVAGTLLERTEHAFSELDTSRNPYLHFIVNGCYSAAFPYALRKENYDVIRENLGRIEFLGMSAEQFASGFSGKIDAFNLSDIFEYMSQESMDTLYGALLEKAAPGARFAYWNMLVPRRCSVALSKKYGVVTDEAENMKYLLKDKAFFYSRFCLDIAGGYGF